MVIGSRVAIRLLASCFLALPLAACADHPASAPTPCSELISGCQAKRLPDRTLTGDASEGALRSTDGLDTGAIMSFDEALHRDGELEHQMDAKTVRVVLGSADADHLRWGKGIRLFYAIKWGGVCEFPSVSAGGSTSGCVETTFSTVIDANTGAFIVSG